MSSTQGLTFFFHLYTINVTIRYVLFTITYIGLWVRQLYTCKVSFNKSVIYGAVLTSGTEIIFRKNEIIIR